MGAPGGMSGAPGPAFAASPRAEPSRPRRRRCGAEPFAWTRWRGWPGALRGGASPFRQHPSVLPWRPVARGRCPSRTPVDRPCTWDRRGGTGERSGQPFPSKDQVLRIEHDGPIWAGSRSPTNPDERNSSRPGSRPNSRPSAGGPASRDRRQSRSRNRRSVPTTGPAIRAKDRGRTTRQTPASPRIRPTRTRSRDDPTDRTRRSRARRAHGSRPSIRRSRTLDRPGTSGRARRRPSTRGRSPTPSGRVRRRQPSRFRPTRGWRPGPPRVAAPLPKQAARRPSAASSSRSSSDQPSTPQLEATRTPKLLQQTCQCDSKPVQTGPRRPNPARTATAGWLHPQT